MHRCRALAVTLAVALAITGACSGSTTKTAATSTTAKGKPASGAVGVGGKAGAGAGVATTSTAKKPVATTAPAATSAAGVKEATGALDTFLDDLAGNDFRGAVGVARDAPAILVLVRSIVHQRNADQKGTTTGTYTRRGFQVAGTSADEVRFTGTATLSSTVSGPAGPPVSSSATMTDPVVRRGADGWRVASLTYEGKPLQSVTAPPKDHTVGPLTLRLVAALNYGTATAVVVQLVAQGDHQVDVAAGTLRVGSTAAQTTAHVLVGGQPGYVLDSFPRNDAKPTDWTATVTVDNAKAQQVVLAF